MARQLGPGFLRKAPKSWIPARAYPLDRRVDPGINDSDFDFSSTAEVDWRVEAEGLDPFEFHERRRMPTWTEEGAIAGGGKRWYKLRLRSSGGLLRDLGVPGRVNPQDHTDLWVDWDAAYAEHEPAWAQQARIEREVHKRAGRLDQVVNRVTSPFAGEIRPDEVQLVDEAIEAERRRAAEQETHYAAAAEPQMAAMGFGTVAPDERARSDARLARETEIGRTGRPATATVVANADTDRKLANIPVIELTLDVDDGGTIRRVVYEHVWGPRHAKRYKVGKQIDVKVDPTDPDTVALAS